MPIEETNQEQVPSEVSENSAPIESQDTNPSEKSDATPETDTPTEKIEAKGEVKPERKSGVERRIGRLTAQLREREREIETLRTSKAPAPQEQDAAPKIEDYPTLEEYNQAHVAHLFDKESKRRQLQSTQEKFNTQLKTRITKADENFNTKLDDAFARHDDFEDLWEQSSLEVPSELMLALKESDHAGDMTYDIIKDPNIREKILSKVITYENGAVDISRALIELAKLEMKHESKSVKQTKPVPVPPKVGTPQSSSYDDDAEYAKRRAARILGS